MSRLTLALVSLAAGAAACLGVFILSDRLREAPVSVPARAAEAAAIAAAPPAQPAGDVAVGVTPMEPEHFGYELARAAQAREKAARDAILALDAAEAATVDARLELYQEALQAAREKAPDSLFLAHPGMLAEVFLRMDSVQRELAQLDPGARSGQIARIRRELGFSEDEIARMQTIDERREARWQNGFTYMQERARLTATFEGEAREAELRALRETFFAHEAGTIEAEERGGFFRFERPRIYGRN